MKARGVDLNLNVERAMELTALAVAETVFRAARGRRLRHVVAGAREAAASAVSAASESRVASGGRRGAALDTRRDVRLR
jgi:hypothetical protein